MAFYLPTTKWSPSFATGVEGSEIALGTITDSLAEFTPVSLVISGIPIGATLSDGTNSFTGMPGSTSVDVSGWSLSNLSITPAGDENFTLTVAATDPWFGNYTSTASEAVTVTPPPPTLTWSPASASGVEGSAIALSTISDTINGFSSDSNSLQSLIVSAIPPGATLSDGTHSFTAANDSTAVNIAGWNLSSLTITPPSDVNFTLTVTATEQDADGNTSGASANEAVTVNPLAPTLAWSLGSATGTVGSAIALGAIADTVNGLSGDSNSLKSLVVSGIPAGAAFGDGTHSFIATAENTSVDVISWNLSGLTLTVAGPGSFTLTATATEQDAEGDTGSASTSGVVTVNAPGGVTVAWSPTSAGGVEGSAISLGAITDTVINLTLNSLVVGAIPVGAKLSDGTLNFTAAAGNTSLDVTSWNLSGLKITPANDANFTLVVTATAQDTRGQIFTASANELVTVAPLAPTPAWSPNSASGSAGSAIALGTITDTVNGFPDDNNSLQSLVVSSIPLGTTLSDGAHSFTAPTENSSVDVTSWNLSGLTLTVAIAGSFTLTALATEQDAEGNTSSASANEAVVVSAPAFTGYASTGYADGSGSAPAGAPQFPNMLNGYAIRAPWKVAGVDYHVGIPSGTILKDPTVAGNLPGGATYRGSNHRVTVTGNNVTLDGFDFSLYGGIELIIQSANVTVKNSKFAVSSNPGDNPAHPAFAGTAIWTQPSASNVTFLNNEIDGGNVAVTPQQGTTLWIGSTGTVNFRYNYFHNSGGDMIDFTGGPQIQDIEYNLFYNIGTNTAHADTLQWYNSKVSSAVIGFNTVYQNVAQPGPGNGALVFANGGSGESESNVMINNDTVIQATQGSGNFTIGFESDTGNADHAVIHDNYIDPTGAVGYTGMWLFPTGYYSDYLANPTVVTNVTNMVSGQTYTSLPMAQRYFVAPDPHGISPSLSNVYSVSASPSSGTFIPGNSITFTVNLDEGYTVTGAPTLSLNNGGTAIYASGSGSNALTFRYTVGSADGAVSPLAITSVNLPNSAAVKDSVGNAANLSGALISLSGLAINPAAPPPVVAWSPGSESGIEGSKIALGAITASVATGSTLQSILVSDIPAGALLSDGIRNFTATGGSGSVNVAGWNLSSLTITPPNDTNFLLTVTANAQDSVGNASSGRASEAVSVGPLAPTVAWSPAAATGVASSPISLGTISDTINGLSGDSNSLQSLVVSAIPTGATLADGTHSFTASSGSTSVNIAGWDLARLTIMAASPASFSLAARATAQDPEGDTSSSSANEVVTVSAPSAPSGYADGAAAAPAGTPEHPNLLSGYTVRPPWQVAGVDYYVGVPNGTQLKDPAASGNLPAGASLNPSQNLIIVTSNNVTLNGFDFSGRGGYGIYINSGVSGTRITNNLFVDSSTSAPIPVNIGSGASNTYIGYNTIDGGSTNGNQKFDETIYSLGTGLTVEYNWIKNAPGRFVTANGGALIYRYNLLEDGGWLSGVHLNFLQFLGGNNANPQVDFNTVVQHRTVANGEGFQMYTNNSGSITNGEIGNNTMISSNAVIENGSTGPAISYWIHAGSNNQYPSAANGTVHDNYIDGSSAYGAFYPGLSGFAYSDNINLLTGVHL